MSNELDETFANSLVMQSLEIEQKAVAQNICQSPRTMSQKLEFWAISAYRN